MMLTDVRKTTFTTSPTSRKYLPEVSMPASENVSTQIPVKQSLTKLPRGVVDSIPDVVVPADSQPLGGLATIYLA